MKMHCRDCYEDANKLVYYLVHELRMPLTNIVSICELLKLVKQRKNVECVDFQLLQKALLDFDNIIMEADQLMDEVCSCRHTRSKS